MLEQLSRSGHLAALTNTSDSPLLKDPELATLASKYSVSPATLLISYQVCRGCIVLPKSVTPQRIEANLKVILIEDEDMKTLDVMAAEGKQQRVNTPLWGHDLVSCDRGRGRI